MKTEDIKQKLLKVVDPSVNKSLGETDSIKHVGVDDNNAVILIIEVGEKSTDVTPGKPYPLKISCCDPPDCCSISGSIDEPGSIVVPSGNSQPKDTINAP